MSIDIKRLQKVRNLGREIIARCPACAELGGDRTGDHLKIWDNGKGAFDCVVNQGPAGAKHRRRIWELAGASGSPGTYQALPLAKPAPPKILSCPPLWSPSLENLMTIARSRNWQYHVGLQLLLQRGLLFCGQVYDDGQPWPAWVITDRARRNAQARRLDGNPWGGIGNKKAKSLPGSVSSWPIGVPEIGDRPVVVLCEGQPDFAAALLVAWHEGLAVDTVAPVCITGAANNIHPEALPFFSGKRVRIAVHDDAAGRDAGTRWSGQLYGAGAVSVEGIHFRGLRRCDGQPVNDLADFATCLNSSSPPPAQVLADLRPMMPGGPVSQQQHEAGRGRQAAARPAV